MSIGLFSLANGSAFAAASPKAKGSAKASQKPGAVVVREVAAKKSEARAAKPAAQKRSPAPAAASLTKAAVNAAAAKLPPRAKPSVAAARTGKAKASPVITRIASLPAAASAAMPRMLRTLEIGESQVLDFQKINRAAVGNPAIADIAVVSGNQLLVNGKTPGETTLFVWDRRGQTRYDITVVADNRSPDGVVDRVRRDIGDPDVIVRAIGDRLFLEGGVRSETESMRAEAIATAYTPNVRNLLRVEPPAAAPAVPARTAAMAKEELERALTGIPVGMRVVNDSTLIVEGSLTPDVADRVRKVTASLGGDGVQVLDLLHVGKPKQRQVMVRCRVLEINRQKTKDLGIDWGRVSFQNDASGTTSAQVVDQPFLIGRSDLSPAGLLRGGPLRWLDPLGVRVSALVNNNAGRVLCEPNMCILEGSRGTMLVGGEIPVPIAQSSGIGTALSVDWKPFGVQLAVEPTAIEGDEVTLKLAPEVSTLDFANAVRANGITIPALRSRRCEAVVQVKNGQTFALGGLLMNEDTAAARRTPLLSKVPILGSLFKSREFQRGETELIMLLTPEIMEPGQTPPPPVLNIERRHPEYKGKTITK